MYTVYIVGIILPGIDLVSNRLIIDGFGFIDVSCVCVFKKNMFATLGSQEIKPVLMTIVIVR